ncbi:MAG: adenylate kinase [Anaerolineae bacterium]
MNILLLGAPGAGKGTQAELLEAELGIPHVASGDLFRDNLREGTELGLLAKSYMDRGELVPDEVTVAMVKERLAQPDCQTGVILDGFPRNIYQAEALDDILADKGRALDAALYVKVSRETLVARLSGRWICRECQTVYHTLFNPPRQPRVCDQCGGELYQRPDDRPETAARRLEVYFEQTMPLIEHYRRKGVLIEVDGEKDIEGVKAAILQGIGLGSE